MATGIKLLITGTLYMALVFIILSLMPANSGIFGTSGSLSEDSPEFTDESGDFDNTNLVSFYTGLLTFNIDGLNWIWSLLIVYLPISFIGLGIYGVIRGI